MASFYQHGKMITWIVGMGMEWEFFMGIGIKLWGHDGMGKIQRNMVEMEKIHGMVGGNGN